MRVSLHESAKFFLPILLLTACTAPLTRSELLNRDIIYSRSSDKHYLAIVACLKSNESFPLPKWQRHTWRDIDTFFIYHESLQVDGYPHWHDEAAKIYYITEIHDTRLSWDIDKPITHGNQNWILTIKNIGTEQHPESEIEIRSDKNLLDNYPSASYTPNPKATLSQQLYKVEKIDRCF